MAGFFQNVLTDTAKGFFGSEYLRDYTHASKTFRTNSYAYAPKYKFLFHVEFKINTDLIGPQGIFPEDANFGLAVKNVSLPKYTVQTQTLNQYNRKRIIQTKINYNPISIAFHDDNANLIRQLWYNYYTYYYNDAKHIDPYTTQQFRQNDGTPVPTVQSSQNITGRNIYDNSIAGNDDWGYIGESSTTQKTALAGALGKSKAVFFKHIDIYGFNQHNFVMYRLVNPIITSFEHDSYDYSQSNGVMQNSMTVDYETVKYYNGSIDGRNPNNIITTFGTDEHYDKTLSPIARPGSQSNILGQGGLAAGLGGILQDVEQGNILGAIQKAGATYNTFKNPQTIVKAFKGEVISGITNAITGTPNRNNSFIFPALGQTIRNINASGAPAGSISTPPFVNTGN